MAAPNYENMSVKELRALQAEISEALEKARVTRRNELRAEVKAMVEREGFTLEELFGDRRMTTQKKGGIPKYRNPANPSQTWTGKGKRPGWMKELLDKGHSKDEFLIK